MAKKLTLEELQKDAAKHGWSGMTVSPSVMETTLPVTVSANEGFVKTKVNRADKNLLLCIIKMMHSLL